MNYERLATSAVEQAVSRTNRLEPFFNSGEKEPSFDGAVFIYDNDQGNKKNMKRVPVQIKGKGVQSEPALTTKYPVSIVDLDNYMHNGGVMFFVVHIDKSTGVTNQIYYSALLPFKIKELLESKKDNRKTISVCLDQFPTSANDMTALFLNFYADAKRQTSYAGMDFPSIEELQKNGQIESLVSSYTSADGQFEINDLPRVLPGKEIYTYAIVKGYSALIPVRRCAQIKQFSIKCVHDIPVSVDGTVYYESIEKEITADKIILRVGSSVTIAAPNIDSYSGDTQDIEISISVSLSGTLMQRIKAIEFLMAAFETKNFELGDIKFPINFSGKEQEKLPPDRYKSLLSGYKRVVTFLERLHVKKDLPLDGFTEEDYKILNLLVGAIEDGISVKNIAKGLFSVVNIGFGGLNLKILCERQEDGNYKLWDYFDKHVEVCVHDDKGMSIPASQYSIMKADDFLFADNLYLPRVIEDFKGIRLQQFIAENGNLVMLEMLKAYDKVPTAELLDAAKQMCTWLETARQFLADEMMLINKLQIVRRERDLTFSEKFELSKVASASQKAAYRIGAFILLDEQREAELLLSDMSQEERDNFMSFPIFRFYTKSSGNNETD